MLRPLKDSILFVFMDDVNYKGFSNKTATGIIYKSLDDGLNSPRWAKVLAVGPTVDTIKPGMHILIEALRWTEGFKFDGVMIWKTVEKEVMAIGDEV